MMLSCLQIDNHNITVIIFFIYYCFMALFRNHWTLVISLYVSFYLKQNEINSP